MGAYLKYGNTLRPIADTNFTRNLELPYVENINIDELGTITWERPNMSKFSTYKYELSYDININGNSFQTKNEEFLGYPYLINGDNYIIIKLKLNLMQKDGKVHTVSFVKTN